MDWWFKNFLHLPQFMVTWTIFFGCGIVICLLSAVRQNFKFALKDLVEHCMPTNILTDKSFQMDLKIYLIGKLSYSIIALPSLLINGSVIVLVSSSLHEAIPGGTKLPFNPAWAAACTVVMFVVAEFAEVLCHYAEHKIPFLWELHKVHHSAVSLNPLTAKRTHPLAMVLEEIAAGLMTAVPGGLFVFLFAITPAEAMTLCLVASRVFAIATLAPLKHSHHQISLGLFDRVLISPHMHQIHHSSAQQHWDKNFGTNLSVFDWIFGTAYKPNTGEKVIYGISGCSDVTLQNYNTLNGAYVQPVIRGQRKLARAISNVKTRCGLHAASSRLVAVIEETTSPGPGLDLTISPTVARADF